MAKPKHEPNSERQVILSASEYFADPRQATVQAERVGRVIVRDESGATRLVINAHRATESLLK